LKTCRKH